MHGAPPASSDPAIRRYRRIAAGAWLALALMGLVSRSAWFVERAYGDLVGPAVSVAQTSVTRWLPVSVAELFMIAAAVWFLLPAARLLRAARGERAAVARWAFWRIVAAASLALAAFYALWGLNYARTELPARLGWAATPGTGSATGELARLSRDLVDATNREYRAVTGSADLGRPTSLDDPAAVDRALETALSELAAELGWSRLNAVGRGPAKPVLTSRLMSRLGVSGVYFPLSGEANVNRHAPAWQNPLSMAHEKAHQRGVTSEDEANFVGYLAAASSAEAYARYSAYLFAQRQLLGELYGRDPELALEIVDERLAGVQRDVDAADAYWRQFEGSPREAQRALNDAYLRFNGVDGGVDSYRQSARLLVLYARQNGGSVLPVVVGEAPG